MRVVVLGACLAAPVAAQLPRAGAPRAVPPTGAVNPNQYGPGVGADATGQPYHFETQTGERVAPWTLVDPNHFAPNQGIDQYGRPVQAVPGP